MTVIFGEMPEWLNEAILNPAPKIGGVAERLKASRSKRDIPNGIVGSNPTSSATDKWEVRDEK